MELLLLSTGGSPFLEHALPEIHWFLNGRTTVGFVTAASHSDERAYLEKAQQAFGRIHVAVHHVQWDDPDTHDFAARGIQTIVIGGGNTYLLLERLHAHDCFEAVRRAVRENGLPYIGASAGANVAGWNIGATNDWNVHGWHGIEASDGIGGPFRGFQFVPWTINPHFVSGKIPGAPHGEAREERIAEYHTRHGNPVLGLPERTLIHVSGNDAEVVSVTGQSAYLFYPGRDVIVSSVGTKIPRLDEKMAT